MKLRSLALLLVIPLLGCGLGALDALQDVPVCDEQGGTDAKCPNSGMSSSGGDVTPTTSGGDDGIATSTDATSLPDLPDAGESSSGEPPAPPEIVQVKLDPASPLTQAASMKVQVEALHSAGVTMALDGGAPVSLAATGANFYKGAIEVYGASMNGGHTIMVVASSGELLDTLPVDFDVDAPPSGANMWLKTSEVPDSQTRAIAVDAAKNVYEVGIAGKGAATRLVVNKRDEYGEPAWPGMWTTYHDGESWGEDVAIGPDGMIHVLGNYKDKDDHTRWWLARLDPAVGIVVGKPQLGEIDEPARGLSIAENGDVAIVGHATVWGAEPQMDDVQTKVWLRPKAGGGVITEWGYSPSDPGPNWFTEMPEDILIAGGRVFVTGSAEGVYKDAVKQDIPVKRTFVIELDHKGTVVREYVAPGLPHEQSGGYALAIDGKGGIASAGWACNDPCVKVGEVQWFAGDGDLVPYARQVEAGKDGPGYSLDIAYSPAGYNVVASAVSMGAGLNLALRVTGRRSDNLELVFEYTFDTNSLEMGQAVAVGPNGYLWFAGLRVIDNALRAVVGRGNG
ncbi:MAG TPA: hypothetical protein VGB85_14295 [Nannocystis sp.]|jgi:hypothetical protein